MKITHLAKVIPDTPMPWEFTVDNRCDVCGTTWRIDGNDHRAPWWRSLLGRLPKRGAGMVSQTTYYVKTYDDVMGGVYTALESRCPRCGAHCTTWKDQAA